MVWKILRPHYWMLDRRVRDTNRYVIVALILLVGWGGQWAYDNLIRDNLALLNSEEATTAIASFAPLALLSVLAFGMLGVGDVTQQLYLASELELLLIAPIPLRTIFVVKLLQCSRATLIPALGVGGFLATLGLARGAGPGYYLLVLTLVLAAMAMATAGVVILVTLLARYLPPNRIRTWMPVAVGVATFALMLGQGPVTEWFLERPGLIAALTGTLLDPGRMGLLVLGFGGLALLATLGAYRIFNVAFHEGWNRLHEVPVRTVPVGPASRRSLEMSRWLQALPAPLRFLLVKEWLELVRNPRSLMDLAQPLVLVGAVLVLFVGSGQGSEMLRPLSFWYVLVLLLLFMSTVPVGLPLLSLAQEGRRIALLRSAPIAMSDVLRGKLWSTWLPLAATWTVVLLVAGLWLQFPLWQVGALVATTLWGLAGGSVATLALGGLKVDFTVAELKQRTHTVTGYLMMGLNFVFALSTITITVWLIVRLFPDSRVIVAMRALADYGAVGWIFSDRLWIPLGLLASQVVFWAGATRLWNAAVRRLEAWEES
jgi:hypothetical protein